MPETSTNSVPTLETARLVLRGWRDADRAPFASMNADAEVMRHFPSTLTAAQSNELVDRITAGSLARLPPRALLGSVPRGQRSADAAPPGSAQRRIGPPKCETSGVALIALLHGPNLNLLGQREPHVYGTAVLADYVAAASAAAGALGHEVEAFQSNHEGALVDAIHAARGRAAALIINPGALTHYSWSLHDALAAFAGPVIEVHISNPNAREPWRHTSVVAPVASGSITGLGMHGYELAIAAVDRRLAEGRR